MFQPHHVRKLHHATDDLRWFPPGGSGCLPGGQRGSTGALSVLSMASGWSGELGGRLCQRETAGGLLQRGRDAQLDSHRHGEKSMSFPTGRSSVQPARAASNWDKQRPQGGPNTEPGDALIKKNI